MLDLTIETAIPLAAATRLVPPARSGKRTHLSTLLRWILHGVRLPGGEVVRLDALRLGGRWVTSREALQRFAQQQTPKINSDSAAHPRSPAKRRRDSERAAAELKEMGI